MDKQYDMTTLDAEHRMDVYVIVENVDPMLITIHDDSNITEIRETIAKKLNVPISEQDSLTCVNNNGEVCDIELTKEDETNGKKMTEYDPPIVKGASINLDVKDTFDIKILTRKQSIPKTQAPKAPMNNNNDDNERHMRPTSIQGEKERTRRQKRQQKSYHQQQQKQRQQQKQQRKQMQQQQQQVRPLQQPQHQQQQVASHGGYRPNSQQLALYTKIQKHSKTHCRLLFVLMEIQLILLIIRWGGLDMILYLIAIFFALCGFRGCRKLHPLWILAFLLWLLLEILLICLYIIAALIETHESIYGSVAAYVALLSFELVLNVTWAWFYFKFLRMVLSMGLDLRAWGEIQMKSTVIFC